MKLEEACVVEVVGADGRAQRLCAEGGALVLSEGGAPLRCWPLPAVQLKLDVTSGSVVVEAGGEALTLRCAGEARAALLRLAAAASAAAAAAAAAGAPSDAALAALLEDAEPEDADAERRVRRLAERLARLDALNVAGMLAAATEGGGARLARRLEEGSAAGGALAARLARLEAPTRAAPAALHARSGAARADAAARALLAELADIYRWLDGPALRDLDALPEISLGTAEGRARALAAAEALRGALDAAAGAGEARLRLGAVRERLRRLARARDALAAALARHLNNALIHLGNEAAAAAPRPPRAPAPRPHHAELLPYAPFMRWLKCTDEKAHAALARVYCGQRARALERELRAAAELARHELAAAAAAAAAAEPARVDALLDRVLALVEALCDAEQDFCAEFFCLDRDTKGAEGDGAEGRRASGESRRLLGELFPTLEQELVALVQHIEKMEPYGAMRALACVGRRVLRGGDGEAEGAAAAAAAAAAGGEARWARAALAAVAVAAKRGADRVVAERLAALPDAVKQARWARAALAAVAVAAKRGADRVVAERLAALPDAVKQVRAARRRGRGGGRGGGGGGGGGRRGAVGARGARGRGGGGQARRRPRRGRAPRRAARRRQAGSAQAQVRHPELHPRAGGDERRVRSDIRARPPRRPRPLVPVAGHGHAARHPARVAPAHAARRAAARELPPPARVRQRAARARARRAAPRRARQVRGRAAAVRDAAVRAAAGAPHHVLRGRGGGGGGRRARGRGLLPRRLQQARAAPPARALPRARSAQIPAPAVPHGGEAPQRGGRAAAGGVARHAGGVHRAARRAAGAHRGVLPGRGAGAAAHHAGHPRRVLRHRARALAPSAVCRPADARYTLTNDRCRTTKCS